MSLRAEQQQRPGPVDRLGDARRLLEVELAHLLDDLHQLARDRLVELGRVQADDLELVLELRDSRATGTGSGASAPRSARGVLLEVSSTTGCVLASIRPSSGIVIWKSESSSSSIASNSWSVLSISSISSTTGSGDAIAVISGRASRNSSPKMSSWTVVPAGVAGLGLDPQQLLAVVPLVQRLGLVEALVALQPHERRGPGSARAPSRARSCRRRPGPRPAPACRAWWPGTRPAPSIRRAGSRLLAGRRRRLERLAGSLGTPANIRFVPVPALVLAVVSSHLGLFIPVLIAGVVIGIVGHIYKSNWLIILGILVIGARQRVLLVRAAARG